MSKKTSPKPVLPGEKRITIILSAEQVEKITALRGRIQPASRLSPFIAWLVGRGLQDQGVQ